jgi:CheY-like chemotaxis protein
VTGERAVELARQEQPELAVLDLGRPDLDGVEVCRRIRQFTDAYIMMVTGRADEVDKIVGDPPCGRWPLRRSRRNGRSAVRFVAPLVLDRRGAGKPVACPPRACLSGRRGPV